MTQHLGILGGGQLGRMLALAARPLGIQVTVLEPDSEAPARAAARHIAAPYEDPAGLRELSHFDVVTFEFENVPETAALELAKNKAVVPPAEALRCAQDRFTEKSAFQLLGIETAEFVRVDQLDDALSAFDTLGPLVLKTRRFGYDGKGQAVARDRASVESAFSSLKGAPAIAEKLIRFERELSVIACRDQLGNVEIYPLTENIHREGVLRTSLAPAPDLTDALSACAHQFVRQLLEHLNYVGVLALELFQVEGRLLANEFAPRVHNSGHWTIEGAVTSQFENHVRAVCGLPLGSAALRAPSVMTNLIGSIPDHRAILALPDTHLHDYEKAERPGRKVGHVTSLGSTVKEARVAARQIDELINRD